MNKVMPTGLLAIITAGVLCSCEGSRWIAYHNSPFNFDSDNISLNIKDGYKINSGHAYDVTDTDAGYDITFHFKSEVEER